MAPPDPRARRPWSRQRVVKPLVTGPLPPASPPAASGPDLSLKIGTLRLSNPVGTASGTYGKGIEFQPFYDTSRLGFVVVKTITQKFRRRKASRRLKGHTQTHVRVKITHILGAGEATPAEAPKTAN